MDDVDDFDYNDDVGHDDFDNVDDFDYNDDVGHDNFDNVDDVDYNEDEEMKLPCMRQTPVGPAGCPAS